MSARYRPRNPRLCPCCFRSVGASRHNVIGWHKYLGKKCTGIGLAGGEVR